MTIDPTEQTAAMRYAHLSSKVLQDAANAGSVIMPRLFLTLHGALIVR
jgi:hypothetical protein